MSIPISTPLRLPKRSATGHKGDYGRVLLIGGSRGMSGAIGLAGMGALRSGAGLVTLALPDVCLETVASYEPSYMTMALPSDDQGRIAGTSKGQIQPMADRATCCGIGPGLGRSDSLDELVRWMYESFPQPAVVDADGLNALASCPACLSRPGGPRILTPHPGEFRRLVEDESLSPDACRTSAVEWARQWGVILVLKGHQTFVTDGRQVFRNRSGNPGMATGGSGDVLTGVITALVGQGLSPWEAALLGVYVHGLAGDLAAGELGQTSLMASDLVRWLPSAFMQMDSLPEPESS